MFKASIFCPDVPAGAAAGGSAGGDPSRFHEVKFVGDVPADASQVLVIKIIVIIMMMIIIVIVIVIVILLVVVVIIMIIARSRRRSCVRCWAASRPPLGFRSRKIT